MCGSQVACDQRDELLREIERCDEEIDNPVYELYSLTERERSNRRPLKNSVSQRQLEVALLKKPFGHFSAILIEESNEQTYE